jgi:hypothetical protein
MRKAGVVAVTVAILTLVLVSAGCGGETTEATRWVTVVEDVLELPYPNVDSKRTIPFELTGVPCRLRYDTETPRLLHVYIVPWDEPTKRQSVLDMWNRSPESGETMVYVEPGTYYLEIEGLSSCFRYHLWLEEQRQPAFSEGRSYN